MRVVLIEDYFNRRTSRPVGSATPAPCIAVAAVDNASIMNSQVGKPFVIVALSLCGGCVSTGPSASSFTVRRAAAHDSDSVFQAAASTLMEQGFRLDLADRQAGRLTTHPIEYRLEDSSRRFGAAKFGRRLAEIRIQHASDETTLFCRVILQRQTTETHRFFALDGGGDDRPQQTPIEREAATARTQNTVWQTVGRDLPQERGILADVLARIPTSADAAP